MSEEKQTAMQEILKRPSLSDFTCRPDKQQPVIWVERLEVHQTWPGAHPPMRVIKLRRGLNILWARPSSANGRKIGGHGAGKTTFCRMLRYILGDTNFGNKSFRERFRSDYPESWILAIVHVNNTPWAVGRPVLGHGRQSFAVRNKSTLNELPIAADSESFDKYVATLNQAVFRGDKLKLAGSGRILDWSLGMQWLTRDQEAHYASLTSWRDKESEADAKFTAKTSDRENVLRLIMGMITPQEQHLLTEREKLSEVHETKKRTETHHDFHIEANRIALQTVLQELGLSQSGTDSLLESASKALSNHRAQTTALEDALKTDADLVMKETIYHDRRIAHKVALEHLAELKEKKQQGKDSLHEIGKERTAAQRKNTLSGLIPTTDFCGTPIDEARLKNCPCLTDRPSSEDFKALIVKLENEYGEEFTRLKGLDRDIRVAQEVESVRKVTLDQSLEAVKSHKKRREKEKKRIDTRNEEATKLEQAIISFETATKDIHLLQATLEKLIRDIKAKDNLLGKANHRRMTDLTRYSEVFHACVRHLLDDQVSGSVSISAGKAFKPELDFHGNFDSAALRLAKLLAFDLASIGVSMFYEGGYHPRFLLHDSPREADLDSAVYRGLFEAARILEGCCEGEPAFQYIITTTEPPPEELQMEPWLLDPILDASIESDRFLGVNL